MKMFEPENLPALAQLLRRWLVAAAQPSRAREDALTA
jgi:hypothetical protein